MDKELIAKIKDFLVKEKGIEVELTHEGGNKFKGFLDDIRVHDSAVAKCILVCFAKGEHTENYRLDCMVNVDFKKNNKTVCNLNKKKIEALCVLFK